MEKEVKPTEQAPVEAHTPVAPSDKKSDEVVTESKHNNNKVLVIVLVIIGVLVVFGAAGSFLVGKLFKKAANNVASNIVEGTTGTKVTTDGKGNTTITTKDGTTTSTTVTEQKLPTDFPSNIPLYTGQTVTESYKQKNTIGNYWQVGAQTSDSVAVAAKNLKSKYSAWEQVLDQENDGSYTMNYKNGGYSVVLIVTDNSGKTSITYQVTQENTTD